MTREVNGMKTVVSDEARRIIIKFCEHLDLSGDYDKVLTLCASLYRMNPYVDQAGSHTLKNFCVDLHKVLDRDEIEVLLKEYPLVIRYCESLLSRNNVFNLNNKRTRRGEIDAFIELCLAIDKSYKEERNSYNPFYHPFKIFPDSVLLPFAEDSYIADILPEFSCDCYEPDSELMAIGQVFCDTPNDKGKVKPRESLKGIKRKSYDYIFTCPVSRKSQIVAEDLYNIANKCLKKGGVMCCLLPESFCNATEWYGFRKILLDKEYGAISIILPDVYEKQYCVFLLYKGGRHEVTMMDAQDKAFFEQRDDADILNVQVIIETLQSQGRDERYLGATCRGNFIGEVDLSLCRYLFRRYLPHEIAGDSYKMGDIIETVYCPRSGFGENSELGITNLSANYLKCDILYKDIVAEPNLYLPGRRMLSTKCLLVGNINGEFRVGRAIDFSDSNSVMLGDRIIPFRIKLDIVNEDFLLRSIMSETFAEQAKILGKIINTEEFFDLFFEFKVIVPSKEEQVKLCMEDVRQSLDAADQKLQESFEDFRKDLHMKKHAIGQTISDVNNWWSVLQRARKENGGNLSDDTVVGNKKKITVSGIYGGLGDALSRLQQQIYRLDRGNGLKVEEFALAEFIENYIKSHGDPLFEFEYSAEKHRENRDLPNYRKIIDEATGQQKLVRDGWVFRKGDLKLEEYVKFPREALTMVLDNIISNACSHGFATPSARNKIRIDFEWVGGYVVATVSNNGTPLHEELSPDQVFFYGKSTKNGEGHFGLGGYEIKRLMQEFGGDAEIVSTPLEEFAVSYKLTFPEAEAMTSAGLEPSGFYDQNI